MSNKKAYDLVLFGVTGFTGKLAVEYLLEKAYSGCVWAACARNAKKAEAALNSIVDMVNERKDDGNKVSLPTLLTADLVCESFEQEKILGDIVQSTHVVLTAAGPFEKYSQTLVKLCTQYGVGYCDITGETSFVRKMIHKHDAMARKNRACIIPHCGADCIPQDLMVYEMNRFAKSNDATLEEVKTFIEVPESASFSGGTLNTAIYQLGKKDKKDTDDPEFDPLLMEPSGAKTDFITKNVSPKSVGMVEYGDGDQKKKMKVGPWIMGPVMVNCVRRSNALLHYDKAMKYGDGLVKNPTWSAYISEKMMTAKIAGAIIAPSIFAPFVPKPGEGPDRQKMEEGYMTLYATGLMTLAGSKQSKESVKLFGKFHFNKDVGYLYTASLLVESAVVLLKKMKDNADDHVGGILTPAAALGHDLTERIVKAMDVSFEIKQTGDRSNLRSYPRSR